MVRLSNYRCIGTVVVMLVVAWPAAAQPRGGDHREPVYQRRAFASPYGHGKHRRGHPGYVAPPVSSGSFQRPYPYHLDYYRMRYGGSYAPYFGNLYGPPQVVTAPPYYGGYGYGPYGYDGYGDGGYGYPAPNGATGWHGNPPPVVASPHAPPTESDAAELPAVPAE